MVRCTSLSNATSRKDESDSDSSLFPSTTEVSDSDESENELQLDPIVMGNLIETCKINLDLLKVCSTCNNYYHYMKPLVY